MNAFTTSPNGHTAPMREWVAPRLERLDIENTRGGANQADEDLIPVTAPPS